MVVTSIVIVTYHTGPSLWLAIARALSAKECREVIVVNNGNPSDVAVRLARMATEDSRLRLLGDGTNLGFAKACNLGAKTAEGDYLLLLNPDCLLPEEALVRCREALEEKRAMLAGCFLMNPDGSEQRGSRRNLLSPRAMVKEVFGGKPTDRLHLHATDIPSAPTEVPAVSGAFLFMRRADYLKLGGMDEGYFLHMEDMDLCLRIQKAGAKTIWLPQVKVLHFRSTSDASPLRMEWHKLKGFLRYFRLHFAGPSLPLVYVGITLRFVIKVITGLWSQLLQQQQRRKRETNRLLWLMREVRPETDSRLAGKTVLVLGAGSQVGICAIAELLNAGAQVIGVTKDSEIPYTHSRLRWVKRDLTSKEFSVAGLEADILVHASGLWLLPPVLPALLDAGVKRVLAFSSMSAVTKQESGSKYERKVASDLVEAENKIMETCMEKDVGCTLFRPTMIYGAGLDRNMMNLAFAIKRLKRFPMYKEGSGMRQPVQARDLARAVIQCIPNPQTFGKIYELGGASRLTYREMVERVFGVYGLPPRFFPLPFLPQLLTSLGVAYQLPHMHGEIALRMNRDLLSDNDPAERDFSYSPRGFELNSDMV